MNFSCNLIQTLGSCKKKLSVFWDLKKQAGKTFVISTMHVTIKPQDYNCPTATTLICLGHLLKVREKATSRCQWNQC